MWGQINYWPKFWRGKAIRGSYNCSSSGQSSDPGFKQLGLTLSGTSIFFMWPLYSGKKNHDKARKGRNWEPNLSFRLHHEINKPWIAFSHELAELCPLIRHCICISATYYLHLHLLWRASSPKRTNKLRRAEIAILNEARFGCSTSVA